MMTPYNTDLLRSLKWMQNEAPNLLSIIQKKADWYSQYQKQFWSNWETNIYDLRTANPFGLMIWCIILGAPSDLFGLYPDNNSWAYGAQRQNFVDSGGHVSINFSGTPTFSVKTSGVMHALVAGTDYTYNATTKAITIITPQVAGSTLYWNGNVIAPNSGFITNVKNRLFGVYVSGTNLYPLLPVPQTDYNEIGGNFAGGGQTTVVSLQDVRRALMLRYATLVSNGRVEYINRMLCWIFNDGVPWDFSTGKYFYVMDGTGPLTGPRARVSGSFKMEYRVGPNTGLSAQFINLLNLPEYGMIPSCAGIAYKVIQE